MLGRLLALALAAAAPSRHIAIYPIRPPPGRDAQALALTALIQGRLHSRGIDAVLAPEDAFGACDTEACVASRPAGAVVPSWTAFGDGAVLSAVGLDDRSGQGTFSAASRASGESELPHAAEALADQIADRLQAPVRAAKLERPTFGLALKVGNTIGSLSASSPVTSGFNLRFDVEIDYLAAPQFWPFLDLSLVLARDASGQRVQLIPLLLGAKYVFRHDKSLRPFSGMALGLNFLSAPIDSDTAAASSFAVYGVGGVDWMVLSNLALVAEASLNFNGLEASSGSGVLFAVGFNLGARVLF